MYSIELRPHVIKISFSSLTDTLDLLNVIHFYKTSHTCALSKLVLTKIIDGVEWHNDITKLKDKPTVLLALELKAPARRVGVESTNIMDSSLTNANITLTITTLNEINRPPILYSRRAFIDEMYREWLKLFQGTPL